MVGPGVFARTLSGASLGGGEAHALMTLRRAADSQILGHMPPVSNGAFAPLTPPG